jgi:hypothetical protein
MKTNVDRVGQLNTTERIEAIKSEIAVEQRLVDERIICEKDFKQMVMVLFALRLQRSFWLNLIIYHPKMLQAYS